MSNLKKWLIVLLSVLLTVMCGAALIACNTNPNWRKPKNGFDDGTYDPNNPQGKYPFYFPEGTNPDQFISTDNVYTIHTVSIGGIALDGVKVSVESKDGNIKLEGRSQNGAVQFGLDRGNYEVSYSELPEGYTEDVSRTVYKLTPQTTEVQSVFSSEVIDATIPGNKTYGAGDVMYNFTYTANGETIQLKELLNNYKFVLINFWFVECYWCDLEFPYLEEIYEKFQNDAYVVAISNQDNASKVSEYKSQKNYQFFMTNDTQGLTNHFNVTGFPTSVFIDRYGVVAYIHSNAITSVATWDDLFSRFCAEDYEQNSDLIDNSGSGGGGEEMPDPIAPPEGSDPQPGNQELTNALAHQSMLGGETQYPELPLSFYGPNPDDPDQAHDAKFSWPYYTGKESDGSSYIYPSNVGTDNTFSILYTDVTLQKDEVLSVELKLNTEENTDLMYIILNNSLDSYFMYSGVSDGWEEIKLYQATRPTSINICFMFVKSLLVTNDGEFVGLRNLKVAPLDTNTDELLHVRTEMASVGSDNTVTYEKYYLSDKDGFYHVGDSAHQNNNDPIVYTDVLYETVWSERHLSKFKNTYDGITYNNSIYNISYYQFNSFINNESDSTDIPYDEHGAILDAFYVQMYSSGNYLFPVTKDMADTLKAFTKHVQENSPTRDDYENGFDEDKTWLELCVYYRALGGDHSVAGHTCLATTNPVSGYVIPFAIPLKEGQYKMTSTESTDRNRSGGLFYKFTASKDGVYKFDITNDNKEIEPYVLIWDNADDANLVTGKGAITELQGNGTLRVYLKNNQTVYPQLSQDVFGEKAGLYEINISREADEKWILETASDGTYDQVYDPVTGAIVDAKLYLNSIPIAYDSQLNEYYHIDMGEQCSPIYISFTRENTYATNGVTLEEMLHDKQHGGVFGDNQAVMETYYQKSIEGKQPEDDDYGMVLADKTLVDCLRQFTQSRDPEIAKYDAGVWKAFAYYYHYYGATSWEPMPED